MVGTPTSDLRTQGVSMRVFRPISGGFSRAKPKVRLSEFPANREFNRQPQKMRASAGGAGGKKYHNNN